MGRKLDSFSNPKELILGYFPSQRGNEWVLNTNQNCLTSDEEIQKDIVVKKKTNRKKSGLSRDERINLWSNAGNSFCSFGASSGKNCIDGTWGECSSNSRNSQIHYQHTARASSQERINPVKCTVEKAFQKIQPKSNVEVQGTINIKARERRRAAHKKQETISTKESRNVHDAPTSVSPVLESKRFADRSKVNDSFPQAKVTLASKPSDTKLSSPVKLFAHFYKRRTLSIPLKPTFPKSFSDDPQEFTDQTDELLDLELCFKTKTSLKDTGEFPFDLDIEEKRFRKGEFLSRRSMDTVVKCFTKDRLEFHGTMFPKECSDDPTTNFIFIVQPRQTVDRQVEYKGVYRRQLAPDSKYISWRFQL